MSYITNVLKLNSCTYNNISKYRNNVRMKTGYCIWSSPIKQNKNKVGQTTLQQCSLRLNLITKQIDRWANLTEGIHNKVAELPHE